MDISATSSSTTSSNQNPLESAQEKNSNNTEEELQSSSGYDLNTKEYMDLFMEQLKNQDPEDPMKTSKMMDQTSSLVQLQNNEEMSNKIDEMSATVGKLTSSINEMFSTSQRDQYISKIGEGVSVETSGGDDYEGELEKVKMEDEGTSIVVGGQTIPTDEITTIGSANST